MAAARFSRNLIRSSATLRTPRSSPPIFTVYRTHSNIPSLPDLESESDSTNSDLSDFDHLMALRRIESAMHQILVKRSTPAWLPFVPGGSYWVPPPGSNKSHTVADMVDKLATSLKKYQKAARSKTPAPTERGWPSKAYFVQGASPHSIEMEIDSNNKSQAEDED
uniref:Uncharacterized protein n=1 Tax=Kalanchoe fedtschenkoi TaxID=63787 RepID=A0A7N1A776_KALFE